MVRKVSRRATGSSDQAIAKVKPPLQADTVESDSELSQIRDSIQALSKQLDTVLRRQDDLGAQGAAIHEQLLVMGSVLEQMRDSRTRKFRLPGPIRALGRRVAGGMRWVGLVFLRPRRNLARLNSIVQEAKRTSIRSRWAGDRWVSYVDRRIMTRATMRDIRSRLFSEKGILYKVTQKYKNKSGDRHRILHVIPNVWVGGSTQLIVDILNHLGHRFDMQILTSAGPSQGRHEGMVIHEIPAPMTTQQVDDLISKFQPDLIHVHYWGEVDLPWYKSVFDAAENAGVPVIENVNTPVAPYRSRGVIRYVYVSNYILKEFGRNRRNEIVIYPGIDLDKFAPPSTSLSHDVANSIGMVYRLESDKLNMKSIDLFIEVVRRRPATRVFIIGHGSYFEPYVAKVVAAGLRDNFVFTGRVPYEDLPDYYAQFSVFVAPVWKESFGQVTPFAMNMARAVGGFDVGAISEIIESNATLGKSVSAAASKIVALLDEPAEIERLGKVNREIAQRKYGVRSMCEAYGQLYAEVLGLDDLDVMAGLPPAKIFS